MGVMEKKKENRSKEMKRSVGQDVKAAGKDQNVRRGGSGDACLPTSGSNKVRVAPQALVVTPEVDSTDSTTSSAAPPSDQPARG